MSMNDNIYNPARAPLFDALVAHHLRHAVSFHVPGHKSGRGLDEEAKLFFESMMTIDYTEITGLDDLHHAEGIIREAQILAADCFGAEETCFLVGGSTAGNLAMITAVCRPGELLLVQRNVHKSVINGLKLAGAKAVFLPPYIEPISGLACGVNIEDVEQALSEYPEAKGLLLTNPNYYGIGINLQPIAELLHKYDKLLLVDEAHGAHYGFHPSLPLTALSSGADAVVQSTHKMLTAMTMGAMLHLQGKRINRKLVKERLSMLQSSSPSYPLLASLDLARRLVHTRGFAYVDQGLQAVNEFKRRLDQLNTFRYISQPSNDQIFLTQDPFKISIYDYSGALTGPELQAALEERGCYIEMADSKHVLIVMTPASNINDVDRLIASLQQISTIIKEKASTSRVQDHRFAPTFHHISVPISFDLSSSTSAETTIALHEAAGRCSAEMVIPYPPGIPVLYPGELITNATVLYLQELVNLGIRIQGTALGQSGMLKVY